MASSPRTPATLRHRGLPPAARLLACVGPVVVLALVLGSTDGLTILPRYPGTVTPSEFRSLQGCAVLHEARAFTFGMNAGIGRAADSGHLVACHPILPGAGGTSVNFTSGVDVRIPLSLASNTSSVEARTSWVASVSMNVSDGHATGSPSCDAPGTRYWDNATSYQWGYGHHGANNSSSTYLYYNSTDTGRTNGVWRNSTSGNAPLPVPFQRNATSRSVASLSYGGSYRCAVALTGLLYFGTALYDATTGSLVLPSGNTIGFDGTIFDTQMQVTNVTDWSCQGRTTWDGPTNTLTTLPVLCISHNATVTSTMVRAPGLRTVAAQNHLSWGSGFNASGGAWWNRTASYAPFHTHDRYYLLLSLSVGFYGVEQWRHGSGDWTFRMSGPGYGFHLTAIDVV